MLKVKKIFATIQGEGPMAGHRSVFIRLAGCPLSCVWCDTDFLDGEDMEERDILLEAGDLSESPGKDVLVISGGEPLAQNIIPMLAMMERGGPLSWKMVQIETSGVGIVEYLPQWVYVVCSPKTPKINYKGHVDAWKYVVQADRLSVDDGLPIYSTQHPKKIAKLYRPPINTGLVPIYLQPCDEGTSAKNKANLDAAVDSVMRFGYRLSIQLHKIAGVE